MKYLMSACLIGENCKYDGGNNLHQVAKKLYDEGLVIPVCPEELGGLPTPRIPAEIVGNQVINQKGQNVTKEFQTGAIKTLEIAKKHNITVAILQSRSPSCGSKQIYDGSHTDSLVPGEGTTTKLLREHGIKVITIKDYIKGDF